jgi:hypothetical protein
MFEELKAKLERMKHEIIRDHNAARKGSTPCEPLPLPPTPRSRSVPDILEDEQYLNEELYFQCEPGQNRHVHTFVPPFEYSGGTKSASDTIGFRPLIPDQAGHPSERDTDAG